MQLISCRNVLIYLAPVLQKKVFAMLLFGLKLNGYLFLGTSENPAPIINSLEEVHGRWKLYKNLETKRSVRFDVFSLPEMRPAPSYAAHAQSPKLITHSLADQVNEAMIGDLGCLAICVDENNHFIKAYGDTTKYLLQKNFSLDLMEVLPMPLAVAFHSLKTKALRSGEKGSIRGIPANGTDTAGHLILSVQPLDFKKSGAKLLLATICEDNDHSAPIQTDSVFDEQQYYHQHVEGLEEELKETKEKLQAAYERLDATNENMQSFNEELLSANEEMQSTNEEMQSINEELHTINADYQSKNKELQELNDDLNNYFRSNITGQLIVNRDLLLMKFSPSTVNLINLLPSDIGRPLSNISTNIKLANLMHDIQEVIAGGGVISKEVEAINGNWYQVMTMPYIQQVNNAISGAIVTFADITELKKTQIELDKKNENLLRINADLDNFVHVASHDLLAPLGNIEVSIDVLKDAAETNPDLIPFLRVIKSSIKKFRLLIRQIATVGKIENNMLNMEMVDINETIENVVWSIENRIASTGTVINRHFEEKKIYFSKKNLRSIVFNLVANAIKFQGSKNPVIDISTQRHNGQVVLTVQDNGIGMEPDQLEMIFDIYTRVHLDIEGSGVGLYLAKKMIDAAGGTISVESKPGKGTKFTIIFKEAPQA